LLSQISKYVCGVRAKALTPLLPLVDFSPTPARYLVNSE